jgi:exodeoxyribonuclease VII large subunit
MAKFTLDNQYADGPDATHVFSVSEFIDVLNELIGLQQVVVQGEITQISDRGHRYFTISDTGGEKAQLGCILWEFRYKQLGFTLEEGTTVQVIGKPSIYKPNGRLSYVVESISLLGEGALRKAYEELKRKLDREGLFAPEHKRTLPPYIGKIGLLTSKNGDAIRDFRTHIGNFGYDIRFRDTRVEGLQSIRSVVSGIEWFNKNTDVDVIVITRGGGSLESLQSFNSEAVARAIYSSRIPVISAVGHEQNVTIADLVADVRASTPTDAGRIISEDWRSARSFLDTFASSMTSGMRAVLRAYRRTAETAWQSILESFLKHLSETRVTLGGYGVLITEQYRRELSRQFRLLELYRSQLILADPDLKLRQGYSITFRNGKVVRDSGEISAGNEIRTKLYGGGILSTVKETEAAT